MDYDCIVIGGGPGGYVAAIRLAQNGFKVACVDSRKELGGTCLNVGCIPSKILLEISHLYHDIQHKAPTCGISIKGASFDIKKIMSTKEERVKSLVGGVASLFKKHKIDFISGLASFVDKNSIKVENRTISTKSIIVATGSESMVMPGVEIDEKRIVSSTGALSLSEVPKKMLIIGGGYIGLELGSVYARLGSSVNVVEFLPKILSTMDSEVSGSFQKILESQGFSFTLGTKVISAINRGKYVEVEVESVESGKRSKIVCDVALVSIGRKANVAGLNLQGVGVKLNERGQIVVDQQFRTSVDGIYAIGDVIGGLMLAHKASEEGVAVADVIAGKGNHVNYETIPGVVYTHPEVASVGKTEEELKRDGVAYKVAKFPFLANSRAKSVGETVGFVKILSCASTDKLLGCHIIGKDAGTLIHEAVIVMDFKGSAEDMAIICRAHPTLNEAIKEAALSIEKMAIHI